MKFFLITQKKKIQLFFGEKLTLNNFQEDKANYNDFNDIDLDVNI